MVILTNLYRPLKYHREQIKSSKTKYSLESEWKNAEILCNHVSQCPNLLLFRLNSEWGKSWNCGRTGNRNNVRNDAGKEVRDIFRDRNCNVSAYLGLHPRVLLDLSFTRASVLFSRKFQMQYNVLRKWEFYWFLSPSENFKCPFLYKNLLSPRGEMWKIKLQKIVGNLLGKHGKFSGTVI